MKKLSYFITLIAFVCIASLTIVSNSVKASYSTSAKSAIIMESTTRRVLYEKNADIKLPIASTTKIVTAIVAIKYGNLDDVVKIDKSCVGIEGSSIYLIEGESLTLRELLYGLMLRSGNDSAVAIARHIGGDAQNFAKLMNDYAKSLGCVSTNFTNPHGLHDANHYTSARDLSLISCDAINNQEFAKITSTKAITICQGKENARHLVNKNKLLSNMDNSNGIKTGYTKNAGRCFVGSAKKDEMQLVCVVLDCGPMFEDCQAMLTQSFANYKMVNIIAKNSICGSVKIANSKNYVSAICQTAFYYPLSDSEIYSNAITKTVILPKHLTVIPKTLSQIGQIEVKFNKQLIFLQKLCSI